MASKDIGFAIYNGGNIANTSYNIHFSLWGNGGLNFRREYKLFCAEHDKEWTSVTNSKNNSKSYADAVRSPRFYNIQEGFQNSNAVKSIQRQGNHVSVFNRLDFPSSESATDFNSAANKAGSQGFQMQGNQPTAGNFNGRPNSGPFCGRCLMIGHTRPIVKTKLDAGDAKVGPILLQAVGLWERTLIKALTILVILILGQNCLRPKFWLTCLLNQCGNLRLGWLRRCK